MIPIISAQHALIVLEDSITLSQIYEYAIFIDHIRTPLDFHLLLYVMNSLITTKVGQIL